MKVVEIYFTGGKDNSSKLMLDDNEIMTLKEWIINEAPTLSFNYESGKREITLFRSHIAYILYY
ncbi:MAG: hypothetical protein Q8920_03090 [Bacillota bacterium]|nr:hypothetical protein [Bacillota bacterium]